MTAVTAITPPPFLFHQGTQPLLVSMPHAGTYVPPALAARFTPEARQVPDTDWHMERLYAFAKDMGASILVATHSRYVVDLNRPPDGASLYPGQSVTGLCPVDTFDDTPIYAAGDVPQEAEIAARRYAVWAPYHAQLRAELDRIRFQHGVAILWDAHSIRSVLPRFFEGKLPDLNLGTANGESCDAALAQRLLQIAKAAPGYTAGTIMVKNPGLNTEYKLLLKDSPNFIGVAKGEDKLRTRVNEIIAEAKKAGDLDKLSSKWLGRPAGDLPQ
eukprot:gene40437-50017_t